MLKILRSKEPIKKVFGGDDVYLFGLFLLTASLTLWPLLTSIAQFVILGALLLKSVINKNTNEYWHKLKSNQSLLVFLSLYLVHLIGLTYTSDWTFAQNDLRVKLPLLILPVFFTVGPRITEKRLSQILLVFIGTTFIATLLCLGYYFFSLPNHRLGHDISFIISHIRFSLYINLAIFATAYLIWNNSTESMFPKYLAFIVLFWLVVFLFILKSITGIGVFLIVAFFVSIFIFKSYASLKVKIGIFIITFAFLMVSVIYVLRIIDFFYTLKESNQNNLELYTKSGNKYKHHYNLKTIENGYRVGNYICNKELKKQWNLISSFDYFGKDNKGQALRFTMHRYLTSKGLRKDSVGISKLTKTDIQNIENGMSNYLFYEKSGLFKRIYQIIWEYNEYNNGGNPNGHSVFQRVEFVKTAIKIVKENPIIGVGSGDLQFEFDAMYQKQQTQLNQKYRLRAHNQIITFFVAFGFFGGIICLFAIIFPFVKIYEHQVFLSSVFFCIALLSMINEDTLETQAGATYFAFFYSLFLFGTQNKTDSKNGKQIS